MINALFYQPDPGKPGSGVRGISPIKIGGFILKIRKGLAICLTLLLCLSLIVPASAVSVSDALKDTAGYIRKTTPDPQVGSIGGEWAVLGLARGGYDVPSGYYQNVVSYVQTCQGVLHSRKYTEYSRVILALTAIGKDPTNVGGYDLVKPLCDYDKTIWQGINGPIFALLALDSGNYTCNVRQNYIDCILDQEISGGGWSLDGSEADVDITAMALQALAKYQDQKAVRDATDRALSWLSKDQNNDGTFSTYGTANCESCAQVIVALCELGISLEDSRFVKNGSTAMDGMMQFYVKGSGFTHVAGGGSGADGMSTEQGFYALVAANRIANGQSSLYRMSSDAPSAGSAMFSDIAGHVNQKAIETLAEKSIINGMGDGTFAPNKTMTRAEFCTITVKALGLTPKANSAFSDVAASAWYAGYVGTASSQKIVNGVGGGKFNPSGTITRQEAATMVARAAKALNLDTSATDADEVMALFSDGAKVSDWARDAMAYCCTSGIAGWSGSLQPSKAILRCEIAQMIYNLLVRAGKL